MNTQTDTEAPSARTQWIAEPLHCEKYFNILPKFLLIFHPCHYSCRSWLSHSLVTVKGSHDQSSEPRQSGATKTTLSAETWNSKYYLLCQKYFLLLLLRVVLGSKEKKSSYQLFIFFQRIITTSLMGQLRPFSYNSVLLKPQNLCSQPKFIIHIKPKLKSIVAKTFQMLFLRAEDKT